MHNDTPHPISYQQRTPFWAARFSAMACPCELLIAADSQQQAQVLSEIIAKEVWRIEAKYSRYTQTGITATINNAQGHGVALDEETLGLFVYAQQLHTLSQGLFDISSGVLKQLWDFRQHKDTTQTVQQLPTPSSIKALLPLIGLNKAQLTHNTLVLPAGMQIDFGGIGKEYAADKALQLALKHSPNIPILINLGGDIVASVCLPNQPWRIGIADSSALSSPQHLNRNAITLKNGAITTSGVNERQWIINGKSYSHLLNPKTGWPISSPPTAVTVAAPTCMQAGMLSTLIMLQGQQAEAFAKQEDIQCWITP